MGLVLRRSNVDEVVAKQPGTDGRTVTVSGPASELLLFAYGRQAHARVDITAAGDDAATILAARLGF